MIANMKIPRWCKYGGVIGIAGLAVLIAGTMPTFAGGQLRAGRIWWSLQPVRTTADKSERPINPIDQLILDRLKKEKLTISPMADRRTLIRRLSFDLIGLPPTPREVEAFVNHKAPDF